MENFVLIAILVLILGGATLYLIRAKKRGVKCVGCPSGSECGKNASVCSGCSGCASAETKETTEISCCCCGCLENKE